MAKAYASKSSSKIAVVRTVGALRREVAAWRRGGAKIGLVPTMGALHEGHLSLACIAKDQADRVVVSIFVNPKQFAPHEDFERYPRDLDGDLSQLAPTGVELVYVPEGDVIYPDGFATKISVAGVGTGLEADFRPHFFDGVATVVTKLLVQCGPDIAVFGEKDYQQLLVIRRLVRDLDLPVTILAAPIVREADGLARSSRNRYLNPSQRKIAGSLNVRLADAAAGISQGDDIGTTLIRCRSALLKGGFDRVDYVELRDAESLAPMTWFDRPARLLAAVWIGTTRLIDNRPVELRSGG